MTMVVENKPACDGCDVCSLPIADARRADNVEVVGRDAAALALDSIEYEAKGANLWCYSCGRLWRGDETDLAVAVELKTELDAVE